MAKKSRSKSIQKQKPAQVAEKKLPVSMQTAGGVTGAVLGAVVAGPVGAIAGGVTGALVGESSARGNKPVKRAVEAIRSEFSEGRVNEAWKSVKGRIESLRKGKTTTAPAITDTSTSKATTAKKRKTQSKPAAKETKIAKKSTSAPTRKKKRAKKKS